MTTQEELSNNESYEEVNGFLDGAEQVDNFIEEEFTGENTPGLDRPVDNVSMFDIADFSLEGKKTYFERNDWNVVVGSKGKSIEMIPTDIVIKSLNGDQTKTGTNTQIYTDLDFSPTIESQYVSSLENSGNKIIIKRDGIYRVAFKFGVEFVSHIEGYILGLSTSDGQTLFHKEYGSGTGIQLHVAGSCSGSCSCEGGGSCSGSCVAEGTIYLDNLRLSRKYNSGYRGGYMELKKGDEIQFVLMAIYEPGYPSGSIRLLDGYTSWEMQYLKSNR